MWNYIDNIPGWMGRKECEWLAGLAKTVNSWTEVGTYCGRSMAAVGLCLRFGSCLHVVDAQLQREFYTTRKWILEHRPDLHIVTLELPSIKAAKVVKDTDVVFIDADHQYQSVHDDILAWQGKCKVLCGHDYQPHWAGVVRAVDELCPNSLHPADDIWVRA